MTTTAILPTSRDILDSHFMPPEPATAVSRLADAIARLERWLRDADERFAVAEAERTQLIAAIGDAAGDEAGDVDSAIGAAAFAAAEAEAIQRECAVLRAAAGQLASRHLAAQQSDADFLSWRERCDDVRDEWLEVVGARYEDDAARRRALLGFATSHETHNPS